jgi:hypothetical protein
MTTATAPNALAALWPKVGLTNASTIRAVNGASSATSNANNEIRPATLGLSGMGQSYRRPDLSRPRFGRAGGA